jgi:integrase
MTIDLSNEASTADPTYIIKSRVIDMKQLEALKKNLPKGIDIRISSNNVITFRARFRKRGHPEITQTFPDLKLAKHWLIEQNRNAMMGIHLPHLKASKRTLTEAVDRYLETVLPRKPGNADNTIRHLNWWKKQLGGFALSAIRPQMIAEKRDELSKGTVRGNQLRNPATVVRYLSHLSHLFTIACKEWEWVSENPVKKVSKPSVSPGRVRYLEKEEIKTLLDCTKQSKSKDLHAVVIIALGTGMRLSEIMNLRWEQVDVVNEVIKLSTSKNGDPRFIPLKGFVLETVKAKTDPRGIKAKDLLFPSPYDVKKPTDIRSAWETAIKKSGIQNFRFHDLRHTTASHLAMSGKGLHDIASLLGHKDLQVTRRYAHLSNAHKAKMVSELSTTLFEEENGRI